MYQWVNPETGLPQLSGDPPAWYRSGQEGPRVLVYQNGTLVDDTSLRVSEEKSEALRRAAFDEVDRRRELLALSRLEEAHRREAARAERELAAAQTRRSPEVVSRVEEEVEGLLPSTLEDFGGETIERLKAIIREFDRLGGESGGTVQ
jgi:hypothetical protein